MKRILLHVCCGPCATHSIVELRQESFDITLFFSNSNIHPEEEYLRRLDNLKTYADEIKIPYFIESYDPDSWFQAVEGYEEEPEGGARCKICVRIRLEKTAQYAKKHEFDGFTTTLTISPHKNAILINQLGNHIAEALGIGFLERDFKKQDGFKKSITLSKEYNLYRQNYCGCIYSIKNK